MLKSLAALCLRLVGWRAVGPPPSAAKMILVAAPHTSNWDLPLYVLIAWVLGLPPAWMGKHTLFKGSRGFLFRALGGIPVFRHRRDNVVQQMARNFSERDRLCLLIAPEGTRGRADYWKSGFYHIALSAGVPIALGYLDYAKKQGGIGPLVIPTGDARQDMKILRDFYSEKTGRHPEQFGPIRLREEDAADGS